jgi:hypothetical protein
VAGWLRAGCVVLVVDEAAGAVVPSSPLTACTAPAGAVEAMESTEENVPERPGEHAHLAYALGRA